MTATELLLDVILCSLWQDTAFSITKNDLKILLQVSWLPWSCPPMRRWLPSPARLLLLTAPSLPSREGPQRGPALLTPITTTTVTPVLRTWAPAPVGWPPPRALTTTPAAPASPALSPPHPAPPSRSRWPTRHMTAAVCPHPVKLGVTTLSCRGHRLPRLKFPRMWYPPPLLTSYQRSDAPLLAATDSRLLVLRFPSLYTHNSHIPLASLSPPSSCYLLLLLVKFISSCPLTHRRLWRPHPRLTM